MSDHSIIPEGENLRRAVRWLSDMGNPDARKIEQACVRFDLTPLEQEFLQRHFKLNTSREEN